MAKKSIIERIMRNDPIKGERSLLNSAFISLSKPKEILAFYDEFINLQKKSENGLSPEQNAILKIMRCITPYSGHYDFRYVSDQDRQEWVEALYGKIHFEPISKIQTETYYCPICGEEFKQTFAQAEKRNSILEKVREHVNTPLGSPIPIGVSFKEKGIYYFIEFKEKIAHNHGYKQICGIYHPERNPLSARFYNIISDPREKNPYIEGISRTPHINSKKIKQKLKEGKAQFLTLEETKKLSREYHKNSKYSSSFKILTPTKELLNKILSTP